MFTLRPSCSSSAIFMFWHNNLARPIRRDRATMVALAALFSSAIAASDARAVIRTVPQSAAQEIWRQSIRRSMEVLDEARGDIDGDGQEESALCYRLPLGMREALASQDDEIGGIAIFSGNPDVARPVFHTLFSDAVCRQLELRRGTVAFRSPDPENPQESSSYRWEYGRDFLFFGEDGHELAEMAGQRATDAAPLRNVQDGRLDTVWLVSEDSTGVGEKLRVRFPRPVRLGLVGIYGGTGTSRLAYRANNRLHRISVQAKSAQLNANPTREDLKRDPIVLDDAPTPTYFAPPLAGMPTEALEIRVEGVYLGKSTNDTKVGELEFVPLMSLRSGLGVAGGNFRTSRRMRTTGVAQPLSSFEPVRAQEAPKPEAAPDGVTSPSLFQTTDLKELQSLEAELDQSAESFEMDDF